MIKLESLNVEDVNRKPCYIEQILELYDNDISGVFYKYYYNNQERWLYYLNGCATILGNDGDYILYTSFCVDENYDIIYMEFDDFYAQKDGDEIVVWKNDSSISESLRCVNRSEMANNDGYTGLVVHHQKNNETGEQILIAYQNQFREDGHIFSCNLRKPFVISFINGNKSVQYMNYRTSREYLTYDLITIKEYGLFEFLKNGSFALQRNEEIRRYFKIRYQLSDGTCLFGMPFSYGYKEEEMEQMIKDKGFKLEVSSYVLDFFNKEYEECEEYIELAEALKRCALEHSDIKKLNKGGLNNENCTL